jgi:hypothetical protein
VRDAAIVVAAGIAALVPLPPAAVERLYSTSSYLVWQHAATGLSNRVGVAVFDLLLAGVTGAWLVLAAIDVRRRGIWAIARIVRRTAVWGAAIYLVFLASWGLNYRRVALADRLALDRRALTPDAARALTQTTVDRVNALYAPARAEGFPAGGIVDARFAAAFDRAQRDLGATRTAAPGRPKHTWLDVYFRRAVVDGMTDPFLLETLTASDLLPFERTFAVAHEWSHLAGYANEGEANFVGWLTCLRGDDAQQYSGWLFLYGEASATLRPAERATFARRLDEGPRSDLRAIAARVARNESPLVADAGWRVYNQYLKANRVESGTRSYGEVVTLVLGTRFKP